MINDHDGLPALTRQFLKPMSYERFMEIVRDRGLHFELHGPSLLLVAPPGNRNATPALIGCIKHHKDRIINELSGGTECQESRP